MEAKKIQKVLIQKTSATFIKKQQQQQHQQQQQLQWQLWNIWCDFIEWGVINVRTKSPHKHANKTLNFLKCEFVLQGDMQWSDILKTKFAEIIINTKGNFEMVGREF